MRAAYRLLAVMGSVLLMVGIVAGVVHREVLDADRFSAHVDHVRADPAVSRQLGVLVTDRLLVAQPDLTAIRPLLQSTATSLVASPLLGPAARSAMVGPLYRTLTGRGHSSVVLRLADVGAVVVGVASAVAPERRAALPAQLDVRLSEFGARDTTDRVLGWVHLVGWLSWAAPLAGLLLLIGAGAGPGVESRAGSRIENRGVSARVQGALVTTGRGALGAALALAGLLVVTSFIIGRQDDSTLSGALVRAAWHQLDGAFWDAAALVTAAGLILLLAGRFGPRLLSGEVEPGGLVAEVWDRLLHPGPGLGPRAVRAMFLLAAGLVLLLQPMDVLRAALWASGLGGAVLGVALLVPVAVAAVRDRVSGRAPSVLRRSQGRWVWVATALALALLVGALVDGAYPADHGLPEAAGGETTCNGYAALCDRPYDDVAFPATHNSMAAANEPGWFFAEQPNGIVAQLNAGIRVLLIDSWYGQRTQRPGIIANTERDHGEALAEARESFGDAAVDSALRVRRALQLSGRGAVEPYLCHALCALGSTEWLPVMRKFRSWLVAHPRDVVTFVVQDTVSPADTAGVFRKAGLLPFVYTPARTSASDQQWPTLGQMIDSGERLVVLMEKHGGGTRYPWLLQGFDWVQDTPFLFRRPSQFSCRPNRGPTDASLFLLNHWISEKHREVSNAAKVNARGVLLPRAEECRKERGRLPNYVAVDFYDRGDLIDVVNTLNGTG